MRRSKPELRCAFQLYDGAEFTTPDDKPSRLKLSKSRIDSG
jgi:hypothetical protein